MVYNIRVDPLLEVIVGKSFTGPKDLNQKTGQKFTLATISMPESNTYVLFQLPAGDTKTAKLTHSHNYLDKICLP